MTDKPWLIDQDLRLKALASYDILDTPPEDVFDEIVSRASRVCDAPTALVSLVADSRQWFKAKVGIDACETPLSQSVCAYALLEPGLLVIPDLTSDVRTRDNPLVTRDPHLRFYAGMRLVAADGTAFGTLCVLDKHPRPDGLRPDQADALMGLANEVVAAMEARRPR